MLINLAQELENYPVINLDSLSENSDDIPDKIKNSIILYNKALESLRAGSEDIAIIELKRAISMNPHFYEAMNLLGICYSYVNDTSKAIEMFKKVITSENNGVKALKYLNSVNTDNNDIPVSEKGKRKEKGSRKRIYEKKGEKAKNTTLSIKSSRIFNIAKYVVSFAVGAIIVFLLCLPQMQSSDNIDPATGDSNKNMNDEISSYKMKYNKLDEDYKKLQDEMKVTSKNLDYYKFAIKLYEVEDVISQKKYEDAADMLLLMKTVSFEEREKEKLDRMFSDIMPKAASTAYNDGYDFYKAKKYQEALRKLSKVEIYKKDFEKIDAVLYYMGKCYKELNDSRNAVAMFQRILNDYPQSRYCGYAKGWLKELTENP